MISLIVAFDKNQLIGKDGWMPWNLKEDLQHFKAYTMNKALLVGRKTFEGFHQPLPNRFHYVLTRSEYCYEHERVQVVHDIDEVVKRYQDSEDELVVIGGAMIYEAALPYVEKMVISLVEGDYTGDTYFPPFNHDDFETVQIEEKNGFSVHTLLRKKG